MTTPQPDVLALAKALVDKWFDEYVDHYSSKQPYAEVELIDAIAAALTSAVAAQQEELRRLREALEFYADPRGRCDQVPDFYDELCFGETAQAALAASGHGTPAAGPDDATVEQPDDEWRCFHCDEVFTDHIAAATHFGGHCMSLAACQIKAEEGGLVELIRKQEAELDRHRSEDTASYREFYSLGADHSTKLREAEEAGYEKGLADGRALLAAKP
jgi:hypothetical protein